MRILPFAVHKRQLYLMQKAYNVTKHVLAFCLGNLLLKPCKVAGEMNKPCSEGIRSTRATSVRHLQSRAILDEQGIRYILRIRTLDIRTCFDIRTLQLGTNPYIVYAVAL